MPAWERRNVDRWGIEACLNGYLKTAAGAGSEGDSENKKARTRRAFCDDLAFSGPDHRIWRSGRDSNPRPPA